MRSGILPKVSGFIENKRPLLGLKITEFRCLYAIYMCMLPQSRKIKRVIRILSCEKKYVKPPGSESLPSPAHVF